MRPQTDWGDWASSLQLQLRFDATPDGGLTAGISLRGLRAVVSADDHSEAVASLLHAVLAVATGEEEARAHWSEPPGQFRWVLRGAGAVAYLRVVHLDAERTDGPDDLGYTVWEGAAPLDDLVRACVRASRDLLAEAHAALGGAPPWTYDLTSGVLADLEALGGRRQVAVPLKGHDCTA